MAVKPDNFDPVVRVAERQAACRACDGSIEKGEPMVSWYSYRNRGQHIHIHLDCSKQIGEIAHRGLVE